MGEKIVSTGQITLVDLIDKATYIYYAESYENGVAEGVTITPNANSQYIGIYNGTALDGGQPENAPNDTQWSKYVGPQGEPGEPGEDGDSYLIETNQEEILKFRNDENVELSPETLEIEIRKVKDNTYFQMKEVTIELKFSDFSTVGGEVEDSGTG